MKLFKIKPLHFALAAFYIISGSPVWAVPVGFHGNISPEHPAQLPVLHPSTPLHDNITTPTVRELSSGTIARPESHLVNRATTSRAEESVTTINEVQPKIVRKTSQNGERFQSNPVVSPQAKNDGSNPAKLTTIKNINADGMSETHSLLPQNEESIGTKLAASSSHQIDPLTSSTNSGQSISRNATPIISSDIEAQNSTAPGSSHLKNISNIMARNFASVAIPTAAREVARHAVLEPIAAAAPMTAAAVGVVAAGMPIVQHVGGLIRDSNNGTQTFTSVASRVVHIVAVGSGVTAAVAIGGIPALTAMAPALVAANAVYTPSRDAVQYGLQLTDNNPRISGTATGLSAAAYGLNQYMVGTAMDGLSSALTRPFGNVAANAVGRAAVNFVGETVDEVFNRGTTAIVTGNPALKVSLNIRTSQEHTPSAVESQILNSNAGRSSLFTTAISAATAVGFSGGGDNAQNGTVAAVLGGLYPAFVGAHTQRVRSNDSPV